MRQRPPGQVGKARKARKARTRFRHCGIVPSRHRATHRVMRLPSAIDAMTAGEQIAVPRPESVGYSRVQWARRNRVPYCPFTKRAVGCAWSIALA